MPPQPRPSARSVEAEPAPPADAEGSRTADALAYGGGALVLFGLLALAFTWLANLWGIVALLGIAGAVALALCWATRRLRPPAVSDVLAGIAAISLTLCVDTVFDASDLVVGPVVRWFLVCVPAMLIGGAICWWFHSRALGPGRWSDLSRCRWRWRPAARHDWASRFPSASRCPRSRSGLPWR
ncbi:hypothetical protein [Candidatus Poriferisodalis sp.]|uniref:hypothetical protein n=1 Tax=Candidatus Poriferisodalis sp. TaxID=3101277 RepID=UPI003B5BEC6E